MKRDNKGRFNYNTDFDKSPYEYNLLALNSENVNVSADTSIIDWTDRKMSFTTPTGYSYSWTNPTWDSNEEGVYFNGVSDLLIYNTTSLNVYEGDWSRIITLKITEDTGDIQTIWRLGDFSDSTTDIPGLVSLIIQYISSTGVILFRKFYGDTTSTLYELNINYTIGDKITVIFGEKDNVLFMISSNGDYVTINSPNSMNENYVELIGNRNSSGSPLKPFKGYIYEMYFTTYAIQRIPLKINKPPIFSLDANSYHTRFDESTGLITKMDIGNGISLYNKNINGINPQLNAEKLVTTIIGEYLYAPITSEQIDLNNPNGFQYSTKFMSYGSVSQYQTLLFIGKITASGSITNYIHLYYMPNTIRVLVTGQSQFYSTNTFGFNTYYNVDLIIKNGSLALITDGYVDKLSGITIPSDYNYIAFNGYGNYTDSVANHRLNGEQLYPMTGSYYPKYDIDTLSTGDIVYYSHIPKIKPPSILPPQPLLHLDAEQRIYGSDKPNVEKWVDSQNSGIVFKYTDGINTYNKPIITDNTLQFGGTGYGLIADDVNDYLTAESFMIGGLVYVDGSTTFGVIIRRGKASGGTAVDFSWSVAVNTADQLVFTMYDATTVDNLTSDTLTAGWNFFLVGRDAVTGERFMIVDGKYYSTTTLGTTTINNVESNVLVGQNLDGYLKDSLTYYPYSLIDPTQYTNGQSVSESEINNILNRREGVEISHRDRSAITNSGTTIIGIKDLVSREDCVVGGIPLLRNNFITLTQNSSIVYTNSEFSETHWGMSVYVRILNLGTSATGIWRLENSGQYVGGITIRYNGTIGVYSENNIVYITGQVVLEGETAMLNVEYYPGGYRVYKNGIIIYTGTNSVTEYYSVNNRIYIGNASNGNVQFTDFILHKYPIYHNNFIPPRSI